MRVGCAKVRFRENQEAGQEVCPYESGMQSCQSKVKECAFLLGKPLRERKKVPARLKHCHLQFSILAKILSGRAKLANYARPHASHHPRKSPPARSWKPAA